MVQRSRRLLMAALAAWLAGLAPAAGAGRGDAFVDVAAACGIRFQLANGARGLKQLPETMLGGLAWIDYDGDGRLDLYLAQGHGDSAKAFEPGAKRDALWRNLGGGRFEDVTERAGLGDRGYSMGAAVGDIDNDGDADLYVANFGPNVLYLNHGDGTFSDGTAAAGVACPLWSTSAAFADLDGDGLLDLYVCNYLLYDPRVHGACTGNPKKVPSYCHPNKFDGAPDCLFLNLGGGRFRDVSKEAGIALGGRILAKGLGVLPTDFDLDGRIDLFVANDSTPNFLWRNLGGARFEDAALEAGVALDGQGRAQACMGVDGGDVDGDGRLDLMVTNFSEEYDTLYLGEDGGFFDDGTARAGLAGITFKPLGFGLGFFDAELDGDLDVFIANGHILDNVQELSPGTEIRYAQTAQLLENDGRGRFRDVSAAQGAWFREPRVARGAAFADFDDDGDVDVAVMAIDRGLSLLENRAPRRGGWLGLKLRGTASNRDAIGARVEVRIAGRAAPSISEIRGAASYLAANDLRRVVGLGADGRAEAAEVRWPSGRRERFAPLRAGEYNLLVEGRGTELPR
jgi:hypothetical protein